jgi:transposase
MSTTQDSVPQPSDQQLQAENARLRADNERLQRRVAELERLLHDLRAQLDAAQRAAKRQAAPFSKGAPKPHPKPPGRKAGHPPAHRPRPLHIDRVVEAPLPSSHCPRCGEPLTDHQICVQYQTDIPPVQPVTTQFNVHVAHCAGCGARLQGRHPEQTSDALGKAAVQMSPYALALASEMKHRLGLSYGKARSFFAAVFTLLISRGAFARADARLARRQ